MTAEVLGNRDNTHYVGCWNDREHHECSVIAVERLMNTLAKVEWVADEFYERCPWCGGIKPELPPFKADDQSDDDYADMLLGWNRYYKGKHMGHRSTCERQSILKEYSALFAEEKL
jgi:hypothetical protein